MNHLYDIIIIGAGASGLMLASKIKNKKICIIDANEAIGAKIKVSGGGRCNITNKFVDESHYLCNTVFVKDVLDGFSSKDLLDFLNINGVKPILQSRGVKGQYFCHSSNEIIELFKKTTKQVSLHLNTKVRSVEKLEHFSVMCDNGLFESKKLVVASGGISYQALNATPIGYEIAKQFVHTVVDPKPALVGFTVQKEQFWMKELSGISLPVVIKIDDKTIAGDFLLTHRGCSGPAVLNASLYWNKGQIKIDFLPGVSLRELLIDNSKQISTQLPLPKSFIKALLDSLQIDDKQVGKMSIKEMQRLEMIKNYQFAPAGTFGFAKAEVTKGGVNTDEIDSRTMQSKLQTGLYFVGEVLDVTGELGGYNFQWAFASAYRCAQALN
jgi:hypothetical protein